MIKLSITLPSGGGIALEADDRDLIREVLYSAMPHLLLPPPAGNGNGDDGGNNSNSNSNGPYHNGIVPGATLTETPPPHANGDYADHANGANNGDHGHAYAHAGAKGGRDDAGSNGGGTDPGHPAVASPAPAGPAPAPYLLPPPRQAQPQPAGPPASPAPTAPAPPATAPDQAPMPPAAAATGPAERQFAAYCQQINPIGDMRRVVVAAEAAARYLEIPSVDPDRLSALFTLAGWTIPHSFVQTLRNAARSKFRWMERVPGLNGHYRVSDAGRSIVLGETGTPSTPA